MPEAIWRPNVYDNRGLVDDPSRYSGKNFLYENKGRLVSIPAPTSTVVSPGGGHTAIWLDVHDAFNDNWFMITASGSTYKLFKGQGVTLGTEITLPASTEFMPAASAYTKQTVVEYEPTVVLLPSANQGILNVNPAAGTSSAIASTPNLAGDIIIHLNRAVCIKPNSGVYDTIQWSVAGNVADWTGNGSGSLTVGNVENGLSGLRVIGNRIYVPKMSGMSFMLPTGTTLPVYRMEDLWGGRDTCAFGNTLAKYGDALYYAGFEGIYKFQNDQQVDIGEEVWDHFRTLVGKPVNHAGGLRGFICNRIEEDHYFSPFYCLMYMTNLVTYDAPILMYDLRRGIWNAIYHTVSGQFFSWAMAAGDASFDGFPRLLGAGDNTIYHWETAATSRSTILRSGPLFIGDKNRDMTPDVLIITYLDTGQITLSIEVLAMQNLAETSINMQANIGNVFPNGRVCRVRVPVRGGTGNPFYITITSELETTVPLVIYEVALAVLDGGEFRDA